jgi:hypothetical protein
MSRRSYARELWRTTRRDSVDFASDCRQATNERAADLINAMISRESRTALGNDVAMRSHGRQPAPRPALHPRLCLFTHAVCSNRMLAARARAVGAPSNRRAAPSTCRSTAPFSVIGSRPRPCASCVALPRFVDQDDNEPPQMPRALYYVRAQPAAAREFLRASLSNPSHRQQPQYNQTCSPRDSDPSRSSRAPPLWR